jgi:Divergent InlB B-repeat domain
MRKEWMMRPRGMLGARRRPAWLLAVLSAVVVALALAVAAPAAMAEWKECAGCAFGHGVFNNEHTREPSAMAVETATGDLFAMDSDNQRVTMWTQDGGFISSFKAVEAGAPAEFEKPTSYGMAVDNSATSPSKGYLYVSQKAAHAVYKFKPEGSSYKYVEELGIGESASGVAVDENGDVFVAGLEAIPGHIHEFSPTGGSLGENTVPKVQAKVTGMAMNAAGTRFVLVNEKDVVEAGAKEAELSGSVGNVWYAVAMDASGNVYADTGAGVSEWNASGAPVVTEGFPHAVAENGRAYGIAYSSVKTTPGGVPGVLYVGNAGENASFEPTNEVTVFTNEGEAIEPPPAPKYNLEVEKTGTGLGTVTSSPSGISCGGTCSAEFEEETTVTLTETPEAGSVLKEWTGCESNPTPEECVVNMAKAAKVVDAVFEPTPEYKLEVEKTGSGSGTVTSSPLGITCGATCSAEFEEETTVTLTETPEPGSVLKEWTGCASNPHPNECVVNMAKANKVVDAVFEPGHSNNEEESYNEGEVYGEVPETTTLNSSGCDSGVNLSHFLPGVEYNYPGTCTVYVTATGEENTLTASDESKTCPGHLTQEPTHPYSLANALEVEAEDTEGLGGKSLPGPEPLGTNPATFSENPYTYPCNSSSTPVEVLTYQTPVSEDDVLVTFNQPIETHDPLHTGRYSKVITLTLLQTKL